MSQGFFLTFEGLDGSGKSTQLRKLAHWLEARGEPVIATRQPGGTVLGDRIRALLLDSRSESIAPMAELGLMFSDRAQSIAQTIRPALAVGKIVLCDRYTDSTEAYQGGGRGLGVDCVRNLHQTLCGGLNPDLTLLLLPSLTRSLERARRRNERVQAQQGKDEGRFEQEKDDFYQRVYDQYRAIAAREPDRVVLFEGEEGIEAVHERILKVVEQRLAQRG